MKHLGLAVLTLPLFLNVGCQKGGKVELKTDEQKFSYAVGQQIGNGLKSQKLNVDVDVLAESIKDVLKGTPARMTPEETMQVMMRVQQNQASAQEAEGKVNKEKGDKYLAENKTKAGVKTTASGLQYEVIQEGKGKSPKASDTVSVHYRGTLIDGTEFDSSIKRGQPASFPVGGVIKGWTEALQLMKVGSKWKLTIPSDLAYGPTGRPSIPPNSVLLFEVELLSIGK